jgi:hypothetical protein
MSGRKKRSQCRHGHPLTDDNIRLQKVGERMARMCRICSLERNKRGYKRWVVGQRKKGLMYAGYTKGNISRTVGREQVEQVFEAVRIGGMMKAAHPILAPAKLGAFLFFNPKIRADLKKIATAARAEMAPIIAAPAIVRSPALVTQFAEHVFARIHQAVPMRLSKDHRDDTISDMTFAWIEGRLEADDVERRAKEFVNKRYTSDHDKYRSRSLDVPIFEGSTLTLLDRLTTEAGTGYWDPNMMASTGHQK